MDGTAPVLLYTHQSVHMKGVELHQYVHIKECSNTEHSVMSHNVCFVLDFNIHGMAPANIVCLYVQGIA